MLLFFRCVVMETSHEITASLDLFYKLDLTVLLKDRIDMKVIGQAVKTQVTSAIANFASNKYKESLDLSKIVLDFVWEKLNQGHWKDVDISWRYTYTIVSVIRALSEYWLFRKGSKDATFAQVMRSCDMGLLMGAPLGDNILARLSTVLREDYQRFLDFKDSESKTLAECEDLSCNTDCDVSAKRQKVNGDKLVDSMKAEYIIQKIACPSLEAFRRDNFMTETPVIITESMDGWPALESRRWTLDYIKKIAGYRTVPIELGSKYTDDSWSQKLMTVQEFIEKYIERKTNATDVGYLAQHQLFNQIPELQKDILIPDYCYLGNNDDVDINAWFGPKGTVSPLHYDPKHNFLAQVLGQKYIRIYPFSETENLYPHDTTLLKNTSQVDMENPDLSQFPRFKDANYVECVLRSGEMLYIPPKFWHFVKSLSVSFSVSFWWE